MPIACIADTVHVYSLANRLNDQRKDGSFCDVLLKVSGQTLPTHSSVLSASSPYFRSLICDDRPTPPHLTASSAPQEIELEMLGVVGPLVSGAIGTELEAVAGLVDYIYTGKINLREDCVDLVVQLAEAFMLDGLTALVKSYVDESVRTRPNRAVTTTVGTGKPNRVANRVVTIPIRRNRKMPPTKLRVTSSGALSVITTTKAARVLRSRKRVVPVERVTSGMSLSSPSSTSSDGTEKEDDDWTVPLAVVAAVSASSVGAEPTVTPAKKGRRIRVGTVKLGAGKSPTCGAVGLAVRAAIKKKKRKRYRFRCKQCEFVSLDLKAIREHKVIHPNRTFECVACTFITGRSAKLLEHITSAGHAETKCSLCGFEAGESLALRQHLLRHDDPKPFFCDCCEQRFSSPSLLALHVTKHTTERPFVCSTCNHAFKLKNNLRKHMLTHTAEKNHMCDQCDFRTAYKGTLRMHLRIHSGEMLSCPHEGCHFQAYSKRHIAKHGLTHNKDKPYVCEVCGQKYAQIESLRRHSRVHNPDTKILRCEQCQYTTQRADKMREHSKKSHNPVVSAVAAAAASAGTENADGGAAICVQKLTRRVPRNSENRISVRSDGCHANNSVTSKKLQGFIEQQQQQMQQNQSRLDGFVGPMNAHKKGAHTSSSSFVAAVDHHHHHQMAQPPHGYQSSADGRWEPPTLLDPRVAHHFPHHRGEQSSLMSFMAAHGALL